MKDKVKQLAEQAGFMLWNNEEWKPEGQVVDWSSDYDKELEKFAQLIVRECADMAESFHRHQYDMTGNLELHEFIREHFGVEE